MPTLDTDVEFMLALVLTPESQPELNTGNAAVPVYELPKVGSEVGSTPPIETGGVVDATTALAGSTAGPGEEALLVTVGEPSNVAEPVVGLSTVPEPCPPAPEPPSSWLAVD